VIRGRRRRRRRRRRENGEDAGVMLLPLEKTIQMTMCLWFGWQYLLGSYSPAGASHTYQ
jgi:hypothetical protein